MSNPKDMFGKELNIGDTIAYPSRRRSSLWMNVAVIEKIKTKSRSRITKYTYLVTRKLPVDNLSSYYNRRKGIVLRFDNVIKLENYNA